MRSRGEARTPSPAARRCCLKWWCGTANRQAPRRTQQHQPRHPRGGRADRGGCQRSEQGGGADLEREDPRVREGDLGDARGTIPAEAPDQRDASGERRAALERSGQERSRVRGMQRSGVELAAAGAAQTVRHASVRRASVSRCTKVAPASPRASTRRYGDEHRSPGSRAPSNAPPPQPAAPRARRARPAGHLPGFTCASPPGGVHPLGNSAAGRAPGRYLSVTSLRRTGDPPGAHLGWFTSHTQDRNTAEIASVKTGLVRLPGRINAEALLSLALALLFSRPRPRYRPGRRL